MYAIRSYYELFAGHAQNRFYRELEEWLSSITRIISGGEGEGVGGAYLSALLERNAQQMSDVGEMLRGLDRGDVDLFHLHHRVEGALCLRTSCGQRLV